MSDLHWIDETEGKELNIVIVAMVQKLEEGRQEGPCLQVQGLRLWKRNSEIIKKV